MALIFFSLCGLSHSEAAPLGNAPTGKAGSTSYLQAKWDPIHFKPTIDQAKDEDCLACHKEVLEHSVRTASPAGVKAADTLAWYQTLDTYQGEQDSFHRRHLVTGYAKQVMDLKCTTCHQGNDPREETLGSSADGPTAAVQRKQVDPMICAQCHGKHNTQVMGLPPGDWRETGAAFQNNCLLCHAAIRTSRHQVNFLKADAIETAGKENPDVCFGCHGGRAWYRVNYPYPRHPWPGSGPQTPDWAKDRPTASEARFLTGMKDGKAADPVKTGKP
ncbi:MAG: hypothetical protein KJ558_03115 [Gammaproteobacteria bacterium]|nr:hypothetical protein [Gammaproteobacteria bacterium]